MSSLALFPGGAIVPSMTTADLRSMLDALRARDERAALKMRRSASQSIAVRVDGYSISARTLRGLIDQINKARA